MRPAVLLWDFGDTLVDERFLQRPPAGCPGWTTAWREVVEIHADGWHDGSVGRAVILAALAERTGLTVAQVEQHAIECCTHLELHPTAWRVATERRRPQALVTVNPDLFADWIVPAYDLTSMFDALVISAVEHTNDKSELCDIALERLGFTGPRSQALLIDNRADLVEAWQSVGGSAYWFQSDERFARDLPDLLDEPAQS
jgi:phosphoglycolate phosphatase-like HAD superfamily hydrolase